MPVTGSFPVSMPQGPYRIKALVVCRVWPVWLLWVRLLGMQRVVDINQSGVGDVLL